MKQMPLIAAGLLLAILTNAAERLTIEPARLLPQYTKSMLLPWTAAGEARTTWSTFALADFNQDGLLDVVTGEIDLPGPPNRNMDLGVYLQSVGGTLVKKSILPIHTSITLRIIAADFNEDGKLDLLANDVNNDMVLALGNGDGTFQDAQFLGLSAAYYPVVGDLDGDSHLDLVAGASLDGVVAIFSGHGDGSFSPRTNLNAAIAPRGTIGGNQGAGAIMIGDANRDGKADIVVASPQNATTAVGSLHVFPGNGDGTFGEPITTTNVAAWRGELGDFNGDGFLDYAGDRYSPAQLDIWLGLGNGRFARGSNYSLSGIDPVVVSVVDLNRDGIADLTVAGEVPNASCCTPLSIFLGKGDGTFRPRQTFTAAEGLLPLNVAPEVVDFNRDTLPDLITHAWGNQNAGLTIALHNGVKPNPGAGFQLIVQTPTSAAVVLEASTNLVTWIPIATNTTPRGAWPVVDTSTGLQQRFYRTRSP